MNGCAPARKTQKLSSCRRIFLRRLVSPYLARYRNQREADPDALLLVESGSRVFCRFEVIPFECCHRHWTQCHEHSFHCYIHLWALRIPTYIYVCTLLYINIYTVVHTCIFFRCIHAQKPNIGCVEFLLKATAVAFRSESASLFLTGNGGYCNSRV